jgi:anti-sigma factor RsiW
MATQSTIDRLREPNGEALNATAEREAAFGLDEQMYVVRLHAEVDDAKRGLRAGRQGMAYGGEDVTRAERRQAGDRSKRHVERVPTIMSRARPVWDAGRAPQRLAAGASAATAPRWKFELSTSASHLVERIL